MHRPRLYGRSCFVSSGRSGRCLTVTDCRESSDGQWSYAYSRVRGRGGYKCCLTEEKEDRDEEVAGQVIAPVKTQPFDKSKQTRGSLMHF